MNRFVAFICVLLATFSQSAFPSPPQSAIASAQPLATRAGFEVLGQGGNAFDAAVAVSAALAVVEPASSGLGGGGFWLLHRERDGKQVMVDGREKAPLSAHRDMFLDDRGKFDQNRSINGAQSAAIPGMPAGIVHLSEHYGRLSLKKTLAPAIRLAREGFIVGARFLRLLKFRAKAITASNAAAQVFLSGGKIPEPGFRLVQPDLAATLERIAENGLGGFYSGQVAAKLVAGVQAAGGRWNRRDLTEYSVVEREPIRGKYNGIRITSASPPSSGGIVLLEALNILAHYPLDEIDEIERIHLVVEALRRAYHDRSLFLGDPDFVSIPIQRLLSPYYAAGLQTTIRLDRATPSDVFAEADAAARKEAENTTHFSILDRDGNRVAATLSINFPFGSGFMPPDTGVLLNDEMDDFASAKDASNIYGLTGNDANAIEPGKRMLSSMTPTFLEDDNRIAILGTPGGSRIISMVLLATLDFAKGNNPLSWVWVPRFHHQFRPDAIQYEKGALTDDELSALARLGHAFKPSDRRYGNMQAVLWDKKQNRVQAASDPRGEGLALVK